MIISYHGDASVLHNFTGNDLFISYVGDTAILRIDGPLIHQYNQLAATLKNLESNINSVVLHIESPGGYTDGLFFAIDAIRNFSKPIYTYSSSTLCSAAYILASATDKIVISEGCEAGSIGVKTLVYTGDTGDIMYIGYPDGKIKGTGALSAGSEDQEEIKQKLSEFFQIISKVVAEGRKMTTEEIFELNGKSFFGEINTKLKLCDTIGSINLLINKGDKLSNLEAADSSEVEKIEKEGAKKTLELENLVNELKKNNEELSKELENLKAEEQKRIDEEKNLLMKELSVSNVSKTVLSIAKDLDIDKLRELVNENKPAASDPQKPIVADAEKFGVISDQKSENSYQVEANRILSNLKGVQNGN